MQLHETIRIIRQSMGLTQENLAAEIGVGKESIVRWEKNSDIIKVSQLKKISEAFGITLNELLSYENRENILESGPSVLEEPEPPTYWKGKLDSKDSLIVDLRKKMEVMEKYQKLLEEKVNQLQKKG